MTSLEEIRANQYDDLNLPSDHALWAYLTGATATTPIEKRMLAQARKAAKTTTGRTITT